MRRGNRLVPDARAQEVLEAIQRWTVLYGEPPFLADWEPSRARSLGQEWRIERFEAGDWPSTRMVRYHFRTMGAAIDAAGLKGRRRPTRARPHLHSADSVLEAIHAWVELYGDTPGMADWDPSRARRAGQMWRVERYYAGDWPSVATVRQQFGSLNAAVREAGYEPRPQGRRVKSARTPVQAPLPADVTASTVVLRLRAVSQAQRTADRSALVHALRDLSSACLNWADRLAA